MINQQSAAIRSTSSTKQHKLICQSRTNTRSLALDRQTTTATESKTTARTKPAILPSTDHHLRVAQLKNNRGNLYNTTLEAPGTQPLAMLLCGFSWRCNRNHYCLLLVWLVMRALATYISMYCVYLPKFNKQMHYYDPYRSTMEIFFTVRPMTHVLILWKKIERIFLAIIFVVLRLQK